MDLHPRCFVDIDDNARVSEVGAELGELARARRTLRALARRGAGFEADPAIALVDRRGRPQQRVLLVGPEIKESSPTMLEFEHASLVLTWASAKREYRFDPHFIWAATDFDPLSELCAVAVVVGARRKLAATHREQLQRARVHDLAPVIVVVGENLDERATRDEAINAARRSLVDVGLAGDEAPVVCGSAVDAALMDALCEAIDERVAPRPRRPFDALLAELREIKPGTFSLAARAALQAMLARDECASLDEEAISTVASWLAFRQTHRSASAVLTKAKSLASQPMNELVPLLDAALNAAYPEQRAAFDEALDLIDSLIDRAPEEMNARLTQAVQSYVAGERRGALFVRLLRRSSAER